MQSVLNESSDSEASTSSDDEEIPANFGVACRNCKKSFSSGNELYSHLKAFNAHATDAPATVLNLITAPKTDYPEGITNCTETRVKAY